MSVSVNGTNGLVFNDGSTQTTAASGFGFKNRIINGAMVVAQRGTSFTNVSNGSLTNQYTLDRWYGFRSAYASGLSMSQQAGFNGQRYCLRVQRAAGDTNTGTLGFGQIIESVNMADLQGQTVTLSILVRAGSNYSGGALNVTVASGTVADQGLASFIGGWTGATNFISATQTITTTGTLYTFTGTVPSNSLELNVYLGYNPTGTAGANDYVEIAGVQLEKGSTATSFDYRPYGTELVLCERYYQTTWSFWGIYGGTAVQGQVSVPVNMRATPTPINIGAITITDTYTANYTQSSYSFTLQTPNTAAGNNSEWWFSAGNFTGLTSGKTYVAYSATSAVSNPIALSAEL